MEGFSECTLRGRLHGLHVQLSGPTGRLVHQKHEVLPCMESSEFASMVLSFRFLSVLRAASSGSESWENR